MPAASLRVPFACLLASLAPHAAAQVLSSPQEQQVTILTKPVLPPVTEEPAPEEQANHIRSLIDDLTKLDQPDFGLSATLTGVAFAPLPELSRFGGGLIQIDHGLKANPAFVELVRLGPVAMPFLLKSLSDTRPTALTIRHDAPMGMMWHGTQLPPGNPGNAREQAALAALSRASGDPGLVTGASLASYTVTVGDVCLVAIGQITGRNYAAVAYIPSMNIALCSPTHDPAVATALRAMWGSDRPRQRLFEDLVADLYTRGKHAGDSLDAFDIGAGFAAPAATRLLFYFPGEGTPIVAQVLDSLKVEATADIQAFIRQTVQNGVRVEDFIPAVSWSDNPVVRASLQRLMERTTDPNLYTRCIPAADPEQRAAVTERLVSFIDHVPADEPGPFGSDFDLLLALVRHDAPAAQPVFERFVSASLQRRRTVAHAVEKSKPEWGCRVLLPLLDDRRHAEGWTYPIDPNQDHPRLPIRVCDEAAAAMTAIRPQLGFVMSGTHEDLDRIEAEIKRMLTDEAKPAAPGH